MDDKNYYMTLEIGSSGIATTYNPSYLREEYLPFKTSPRNINVGQYFDSDSLYDESLGSVEAAVEQGLTVDDLRAEKLSGWAMAGNALANNLVIAGTTAVGGVLGLVDGIFESIAEGDVSKLWDNQVNNWVVDIQDATREAMPIYRGKEYEDKSLLGKMGSGIFWADLVLNLGFMEGMLIPGMGVSKLVSSAPSIVRRILPSIVSSVGEASIEAINARNDEVNNKKLLALQRYNELASQIDSPELLGLLYNEYQLTLQDIDNDATNAGNFVFGSNIALLSMTNSIEFGSLFERGFNTAKRLKGAIKRQGEGLGSSYGVNVGSEMAVTAGKKVLDMFTEGMEEVSQSAISSTPSNYLDYNTFNESKFNPEKRELVSDLWSAFGKTYAETLKDPNTLVEFASGFITGGIGVPMLKLSKMPIKLENNVVSELYSTYKEAKKQLSLAEEINNRLADNNKIQSYYNGVVRHLALLDRKNSALDRLDEYDYKSSESALLISDIQMFDDAGDLDNFRTIVEQSIDTSDEGIDNIILETSKDGNGPFMQNGNPMSREEVREILEKRKQEVLSKIDSYSLDKQALESAYPNVDSSTIKNALFIKGLIRDHYLRFESLLSESYDGIRNMLLTISIFTPQELSEKLKSILSDMTVDNFFITYSTLPEFKQAIDNLLNDDTFFPLDLRQSLKFKILDMEKLKGNLAKHNQNLKDLLTNPLKSAQEEQRTLLRVVLNQQTKLNVQQLDKINNSSVSDIVRDIENAELDFDSLDDFFSEEEATDAMDKVLLARDIIDTDKRARTDLELLASTDLISELELADALALLDNSKSVAESSDELLDLETEAFNDIHALDDVDAKQTVLLRAEEEGWTIELALLEYNNIMGLRLDAAKNALLIVRTMKEERDAAVSDIPTPSSTPIEETPDILTGHDSVDLNTPINAPKQLQRTTTELDAINILNESGVSAQDDLVKSIKEVLEYTDMCALRGMNIEDLFKAVMNTESYKKLLEYSLLINNTDFIYNVEKAIARRGYIKENLTLSAPKQLQQPILVDNTPNISPEVIDTHIDTENLRDALLLTTEAALETAQREGTSVDISKIEGTYNYWRPSTTEFPIHRERGNDTPYWQITNSPARDRYRAVYEYLKNNGAFSRIKNNQVKKGDEIHFGISKELSEKVGKPIILILNSNNEVIGDLPMPEDANFSAYTGLSLLYEEASNWYKENHESLHADGNDIAVIPSYKSNVARNMVGKPQYTSQDERHTLNLINTVTTSDGSQKQVPFRLGIAIADSESERIRIMSDAGRSKSQGASPLERTIIAPLRAMKGQPFLLMLTSSDTRAFMPVPIMMPTFDMSNPAVVNSAIGLEISKKVQELATISNNTDLIMKWIDSMQELLSIPEIHVNFSNPEFSAEGKLPQELIVTIKKPGDTKLTTIFRGPQELAPNSVLAGLSGSMFQVSRKYINDTYNGRSYNEMIGELAETNLPIGATHTINDWFTIDPIINKKQQKAHSPKSTRVNPTLTQGTVIRFKDASGNSYYLTNSNRLYKENLDGNDIELTDSKYNYLKAHAYGARIGETYTKPYDTPWGYYNPLTGKFEVKPSQATSEALKLANKLLELDLLDLEALKIAQQGAEALRLASEAEIKAMTNEELIHAIESLMATAATHKEAGRDALANEMVKKANTYQNELILRDVLEKSKLDSIEELLSKALDIASVGETHRQRLLNGEYKELHKTMPPKGSGLTEELHLINIIKNEVSKIEDAKRKIKKIRKDFEGRKDIDEIERGEGARMSVAMNSLRNAIGLYYSLKLKDSQKPSQLVTKETEPKITKEKVQLSNLKVGDVYELSYVEYPNAKPEAFTVEEVKPDGRLVVHKNSDFSRRMVTPKNINDYGTPKIIRISLSTQLTKLTAPLTTRQDLLDALKEVGLLNSKERNIAIEKLSDDRLAQVAGMSKLKARLILERFDARVKADMTSDEVNAALDGIINSKPLYREVTELMIKDKAWNIQDEVNKVLLVLPQLGRDGAVNFVNGLIKIVSSRRPSYAWGLFLNGIITLSNIAARGTMYHEAFHFVTLTLLSKEELDELYQDARKKKKYSRLDRVALEEELAEKFRRYMQSYEDNGPLMNIFNKLKRLIKALFGKETVTNKLFHDIRRGALASRSVNTSRSRFNKQEEYTKEQQSILDNAPRDSQGRLLAPNGKPSNLNERQYVQVRTKAFKNWFGDWINNPSEASKVVDENGEPKVMYHGTPWGEFNIFKHFQPNTGDRTRPGEIYFATNSFLADRYKSGEFNKGLNKPHIFEVFLNIRNPFINIGSEITERKDLIYETSKYYDILSEDEYNDVSKLVSDLTINDENHPYSHVYTYTIYQVISNYFYDKGDINRFNKFVKDMTNKGFNDGMIFATKKEIDDNNISFEKQRQVYIINPNQIKSATSNNGEFSTTNDDIRYRKVTDEIEAILDELNLTIKSSESPKVIRDTHRRFQLFLKDPNTLKWSGNTLQYSKTNYLYIQEAIDNIPAQYSDFLEVVEYRGRYIIVYRKGTIDEIAVNNQINANKDISNLRRRLNELKNQANDNLLLDYEEPEVLYRVIRQHYIEKFDYGRLSLEQKDYITERGLSIEEYNSMTPLEKEVLFRCMY